MTNHRLWPLFVFLAACPFLSASGCVVGDDEFEEARNQRDEYRARLQEVYQANDRLNQEIGVAYAEVEGLSSRLALAGAADVQRELGEALLTPPPAKKRQKPRGAF